MLKTFKQFRADHWAWVHAKIVFILWASLTLWQTPTKVDEVLDRFLVIAICSVIIVGMVSSMVGLYLSMNTIRKKADFGVRLELAGLWLSIGGPLGYMVTQAYILTTPNPGDRIPQVALAYLIMAFVLARIMIIYVHRKRATNVS
jgi:uncharacterized membrane protein